MRTESSRRNSPRLEKEGEIPLLAISASQQFQAALKDRLAEVPVLER